MRLASMRYKDYTWPHNPETYTVEYRRSVVVHKVPFGGYLMQDLGKTYRVLRGEGVFAGENAYDQFRELEAVFEEEDAGILVHPVWETVREDPASYSAGLIQTDSTMEHPAAPSRPDGEDTVVYTVKKGDTLWGIAGRYGVSLTALIAANPQIKNPNLIYPGNRVQIP